MDVIIRQILGVVRWFMGAGGRFGDGFKRLDGDGRARWSLTAAMERGWSTPGATRTAAARRRRAAE